MLLRAPFVCPHPLQIKAADRKEVRFFTRGEFSSGPPPRGFLPPDLPLRDFTQHHRRAAAEMQTEALGRGSSASIIVDGGPHTLWWSIQNPDGSEPQAVAPTDPGDGGGLIKWVFGRGDEGGALVKPAPIPLLLGNLQVVPFCHSLTENTRRS